MCLLFVSRQDTNAFVREAIGNFVQENVPLLQELSLERRVILKTLIIRREYINHQEKKIFEFPIRVRISSHADLLRNELNRTTTSVLLRQHP